MKKILIYNGAGADPFSVRALVFSLEEKGFRQILLVGKHFFNTTEWFEDTQLLIFPGGRDVPYHLALKGKRNQNIASFVHEGGHFLGICAGAYYGSAHIEFEKGGPLEVHGTRELQFFPGTAAGPAYGPGEFCYGSQEGARIAKLLLPNGQFSFAYYNGGCAFLGAEQSREVLARYADLEGTPPAIIRCIVGKGTATLCGVHPEYSTDYPETKTAVKTELVEHLEGIEKQSRQMLSLLFACR